MLFPFFSPILIKRGEVFRTEAQSFYLASQSNYFDLMLYFVYFFLSQRRGGHRVLIFQFLLSFFKKFLSFLHLLVPLCEKLPPLRLCEKNFPLFIKND